MNFPHTCTVHMDGYNYTLIDCLPSVFRIVNLVHEVDKGETELLSACAQQLRQLTHVGAAAEVYEKMGDIQSLVALYVETQQWENVSTQLYA